MLGNVKGSLLRGLFGNNNAGVQSRVTETYKMQPSTIPSGNIGLSRQPVVPSANVSSIQSQPAGSKLLQAIQSKFESGLNTLLSGSWMKNRQLPDAIQQKINSPTALQDYTQSKTDSALNTLMNSSWLRNLFGK